MQTVEPGSAADRAGVLANDVLVALGGEPVSSVADVSRIIRSKKPGEKLKIELVRESKRQTVEAELGQR